MIQRVMTAAQAREIAESLAAAGIRTWIMGGWGIDALLGQQTRTHHDLDLLVSVAELPSLDAWLREQRFGRAYVWEENAPVVLGRQAWDTAFVAQHQDGRELDVHAVHLEGSSILLATKDPWELPPPSLDGAGTIGGGAVRCVTAEAQRAMHRGYELPEEHREDLRRLDRS